MSIALYRKYRPKLFSEVTNQNHIKITLQHELESGRLGHAYLFCGPRGTGKTTLARLLAKAANCENLQANGESCNTCPSCLEALAGRALDIIEIDAASHTQVDNIRENVINNVRFTPNKSKYKIFIIDEVHMLSGASFNALLKTLEEPPQYVIFILATTEAHKVPATIISRCQRFDFKKIMAGELADRLRWISGQEGVSVDERVLSVVAQSAGGCVRDAESLLEQLFSMGGKKVTWEEASLVLPRNEVANLFSLLQIITTKNKVEVFSFVAKLLADGVDTNLFLDNFVDFVRQNLIYKISGDLTALSANMDDVTSGQVRELLSGVAERKLINIIKTFLESKELFKQNYLPQLGLEMAILEAIGGEEILPAIKVNSAPVKETVVVAPSQPVVVSEVSAPIIPVIKESPAPSVSAPEVNVTKVELPNETAPIIPVFSPAGPNQDNKNAGVAGNDFNMGRKDEVVVGSETGVPVIVAVEPRGEATLESFLVYWPQILKQLEKDRYSLFMSLHMGRPLRFENNRLTLAFIYELQRSRVDEIKAKTIIRTAISAIWGRNVEIETIIDANLKIGDLAKTNALAESVPRSIDEVASDFGGEVVG